MTGRFKRRTFPRFERPAAWSARFAPRVAARVAFCRAAFLAAFLATSSTCGLSLAASRSSPAPFQLLELHGSGQPLSRHWVDLDGDRKVDLVVISGTSSTPSPPEEDRIGALVSYLRVTPSFLDRRQILLYRQTAAGFVPWGSPLPLPGDATAVDVADLDSDGRPEILFAAGYRIYAYSRNEGADEYSPEPRTLCDAEMLLGTTRSFIPGARLVAEWAESRSPALMFSTSTGIEIRRPDAGGKVGSSPDAVLREGIRIVHFEGNHVRVIAPLPRIVDADGDGTRDMLFQKDEFLLFPGRGDGTFSAEPLRWPLPQGQGGLGLRAEDVNGDGLLDLVSIRSSDEGEEQGEGKSASNEDKGSNKEGKGARNEGKASSEEAKASSSEGKGSNVGSKRDSKKEPPLVRIEVRYGLPGFHFPDAADRVVELQRTKKYQSMQAKIQKIDADGRPDILLTGFATSLWQVARVMVTKKISFQVTFATMLQRPDGSFAPPQGDPLETKVTLDLKRGLGSLPTGPEGDYNGDGITDLLDFSEDEVRIHLTSPAGVFEENPSWVVPLLRAPDDRALLDVMDVNSDGRSDIAFFNLEPAGFVATVLRSRP